MPDCRKLIQIGRDVSFLRLQTLHRILDGGNRVWREVFERRQQRGLIARIDDDVAALHDVIYPRAVVERVHAAPAVEENDHWRATRLGRVRLEEPVFLPALAVAILDNACMRVLTAAWTTRRLQRRGDTLRPNDRQGEQHERENQNCPHKNPPRFQETGPNSLKRAARSLPNTPRRRL